MDLKITTLDGTSVKLSDYGASLIAFDEEPAEIDRTTQSFNGRNGSLDYGGRYTSKKITATILMKSDSISDDLSKQQQINGLLSNIDGYYIQQLYSDDGLYDFSRPGENTGEITFAGGDTTANKRFLVYRSDTNSPDFQGKAGDKLLSTWEFEFKTKELPFGESITQDISVSSGGSVQYGGTIANNQLESGWYVQITASEAKSAGFDFTIGSNHWECSQTIESGDVIKLAGITNLLNGVNFNALTNAKYFVLNPGTNKVTSTLAGTIILKDVKNLYL
ncbi:phage tail family protein [Ligilactobacillus sp. WILCCON 0076]|uniref:Phage tail family protein n=1 Tax=Ligilactobacillus ubinensis TaxID=2876789 RepID=A0A9X2FGC6_9LACO|nr:phage tail domain-containing protein [Ligilactobacillus ubinensis]MCP0885922.1 phage tail family protein [Ligilactobacillus ubinensis]